MKELEQALLEKTYYQSLVIEHEKSPIQQLGALYISEQQKEGADLTLIRYSQGELYYHYKDYEAAIFKWEQVLNDLEPWAKKNIADAYYEIGLLNEAEDIYSLIETSSTTLRVEVALRLFQLNIDKQKLEGAYRHIQKAIAINPDYPSVTETAISFYEEQKDWKQAIDLCLQELERTRDIRWLMNLLTYIKSGYAKNIEPAYFQGNLESLLQWNERYFVQLATTLWNDYLEEPSILDWLHTFNIVLENSQLDRILWEEVEPLFKQTYLQLVNGIYTVSELERVIPSLLENWIKITKNDKGLFPATAMLAWSEVFPQSINQLYEAEQRIFHVEHELIPMEEAIDVFHVLNEWVLENRLKMDHRKKWLFTKLQQKDRKHLYITSSTDVMKRSFVQSLMKEQVLQTATHPYYISSEGEAKEINEISKKKEKEVEEFELLDENSIVEVKWPSSFLEEYQYALLTAEDFTFASLSDGVLYILNPDTPFSDIELANIIQIREQAPDLPIHFVIRSPLTLERAKSMIAEVKDSIHDFFPESDLFFYSSQEEATKHLHEFIASNFFQSEKLYEGRRASNLLRLIREMFTDGLNYRSELENDLEETAQFQEMMLEKLNALKENVEEWKQEKALQLTNSYKELKQQWKQNVREEIPSILQKCKHLIKEDSDFSTLHLKLNENMNEQLQQYFHEEFLPTFRSSVNTWLEETEMELKESQQYLKEMAESLNGFYEEEKLSFPCNFHILEDWRRDVQRLMNRLELDHYNILNRTNLAQLLLKSAGKLFKVLPQNQSILYTQYKKYVSQEKYEEITEKIISDIFLEFDLFEKALKVDTVSFYVEPLKVLTEVIEETETEIVFVAEELKEMRSNPEKYEDPLKLLETRLLQYEFMVKATVEVDGTIHSSSLK